MVYALLSLSLQEGRQASLAADFSITQFRYLGRLLMWHGRNRFIYFFVVVFPLESWYLSVDGGYDHVSTPVADSDDDYDDDGVHDNDSAADYFSDDGGDDDDDDNDKDDNYDDHDSGDELWQLHFLCFDRKHFHLTKCVLSLFVFSFQLQEIRSSGPVCHPQRTYYFRNAGRLACFAFEPPVLHSQNELTNVSPLANKLSSGIFLVQSSPLYSRTYWKGKTIWQLKQKKKRGRGRIPTLYLSSFSKQSRGYLGLIGLDLSCNQFFQRLKIWRAAGDMRPSRVTSTPETNSEGFGEQI